jgi:rhamnogalacturonyl hydrolase YesR
VEPGNRAAPGKNHAHRDARRLRAIGEASHWRLGDRLYHADDHCAGFMYLDFHDTAKGAPPEIIAGVQSRLDWIMRHPSAQPVNIAGGQDRWSWCDALFMAPPVWARLAAITGERAYLDFMDAEWRATTAHLYSREERLFFRDSTFFDKREANGEKIFWSRGNGWVLVALTLVLDLMPEDYPARPRYLALYRDMAARIAALQPADGAWRASLLDPGACAGGETSGTAFFCAALAWGLNRGVLEPAPHRPVVDRAWRARRGDARRRASGPHPAARRRPRQRDGGFDRALRRGGLSACRRTDVSAPRRRGAGKKSPPSTCGRSRTL